MVHYTSALRVSSVRIVLSVSVVMWFRLFSHNVTEAYLQRKSNLTRKVNISPKHKYMDILGLKYGEIFELVKPLYVLCDVGDYWGETIMTHLINYLPLRQTHRDAALYYHYDGKKLTVISVM